MKKSPFRYEDVAKELIRPRPNHRPASSSLKRITRSTTRNYVSHEDNEEMDIMRMASRTVKTNSLTKRTAYYNKEDKEETSSVESKRPKLNCCSVASNLVSECCNDYEDKELFDDDELETDQNTWKKDDSFHIKGNHYTLSKIVDYLQTRTLASYFKNPTRADRMKSSGLANVTKSLMAASVVHLGGKYDRHADSYLRGLRLGLSYASDRHEKQQEEGSQRGQDPAGVSQDLREVYCQKKTNGGRKRLRLSLSECQNKTGKRVFPIRQHKRCDEMGDDKRTGVKLCTLQELKQLETLRCKRSNYRKKLRPRPPRRRPSGTSAPAGKGRGRGKREELSARSSSRKRSSYEPGVLRMAAGSTHIRARKPKVKRPKKRGGRSKRR